MTSISLIHVLGPWCDFPLCCEGTQQSPIDLVSPTYDEDLPQIEFSMEYMDRVVGHLVNNGHTSKFCHDKSLKH